MLRLRYLTSLCLLCGCYNLDGLRLRDLGASDASPPPGVCSPGGELTDCAGRGFLFCDGFESSSTGSFPQWNGGVFTSSGGGTSVATVVQSPVCHGNNAYAPRIVGPNQTVYVSQMIAFGSIVNIRAYVYLPRTTNVPVDLMGISNGSGDIDWVQIDPTSGTLTIDRSFTTDLTAVASTALTAERWICLEWRLKLDAVDGASTLLVDGTVIGHATGVPLFSMGKPVPNSVALGESSLSGAPANYLSSVFFDEVVLSDKPIGCD